MRRVEVVLHGIIVGRRGNHHKGRILVCRRAVRRRRQIQVLLRQIFLDVVILYRRLTLVDHVYFLLYDVNRHYRMMLTEERGNTQTHVTRSCDCYFHNAYGFL